MKIKIYSGLSLSEADVRKRLPDAIYAPPIARGDLARDIALGVHVVGIIDGVFFQNLAIAPTEIMDALRSGMSVYGASSMGALRAAELWRYGMIGCGEIFERIKNTPYFPDDHLGQLVAGEGPASAAGLALVDFESTLDDLKDAHGWRASDVKALKTLYAGLHFSRRSMGELRAIVRERRLQEIVMVCKKTPSRAKTRDALTMLAAIESQRRLVEKRKRR